MTDVSGSPATAADRRSSRYGRYAWVLLTNWRKLLGAAFYVFSGVWAAVAAWRLGGSDEQPEPLQIPLVAGLASWAVVALVRGLDGRPLANAGVKQTRSTPQERLVRRWLQGTIALSLLLLISTFVDRLNP